MSETPARPWHPPRWVAPAVVVIALIPAAWGVFAVFSDFLRETRYLGTEPKKALEHFYGDWILRFLIITLLISPIRRWTGWNWIHRYRRRFGIVAFTYACLHLLTYALIDVQLNWTSLAKDLTKRWYIIIGMTAFVLLATLAVTSTKGWVKRLGKNWVKLHRLIYVIVILGTMHYWMSVKRDIRPPAMYALIFAVLLGYRLWLSLRSPSRHLASNPSPRPSSTPSA